MNTGDLATILTPHTGGVGGSKNMWGTVTALSPLGVRIDGDTVALTYSPKVLSGIKLAVNDRVLMTFDGGTLVVLGKIETYEPRGVIFNEWGVFTQDFTDHANSSWQAVNGATAQTLKRADGTSWGTAYLPLPELKVGDRLEIDISCRAVSTATSIAYGAAWYQVNPWTQLQQSTTNGLVSANVRQATLRLVVNTPYAAGATCATIQLYQSSAVTPTIDAGNANERYTWVYAKVIRP